MTWDIENFLENLSGSKDVETNDNLVCRMLVFEGPTRNFNWP
jgi:hypothetical protein